MNSTQASKKIEGFKGQYLVSLGGDGGYVNRQSVMKAFGGIPGISQERISRGMTRIENLSGLPMGAERHILNQKVAASVLAETRVLGDKA